MKASGVVHGIRVQSYTRMLAGKDYWMVSA